MIAVLHQIHDVSNIAIGFEILIFCVDLRHEVLMEIEINIIILSKCFKFEICIPLLSKHTIGKYQHFIYKKTIWSEK